MTGKFSQSERWWDIDQDGLPSRGKWVWIHNGQPVVSLAFLNDEEDWVSVVDPEIRYSKVEAWRSYEPPKPPKRIVTWVEPLDTNYEED